MQKFCIGIATVFSIGWEQLVETVSLLQIHWHMYKWQELGLSVSYLLEAGNLMSGQWAECMLSRFSNSQLFVMLWAVAPTRLLCMRSSRQEHWSGLPWPPPGTLPHPGIEPVSPVTPAFQVDSLLLSHLGSPVAWEEGLTGGWFLSEK